MTYKNKFRIQDVCGYVSDKGELQFAAIWHTIPQNVKVEMPIHQKSELELRIYKELMIPYQIPGVTLVLTKDGVPVIDQAFGYANLAQNRPASTSHYTRIASISKVFTRQAILFLV